jgi:hypothetical protein
MRSTSSLLRQLQRLKGTRTITGTGIPSINDGREGDFVLRKTQNGVKLYAKYSGQWYGFVPESKQSAEVDLNQTISGSYTQAEVQAISDKVDSILAKLRVAGIIEGRIKD